MSTRHNLQIVKTGFIAALMTLYCLSEAYAEGINYRFYVTHLGKYENVHGQRIETKFCENKINVRELGISDYTVAPEAIFVSPDEGYFVFRGSYGRHGHAQWFLVGIKDCKVIRKIVIDDPNYSALDYHAAFSPDSKKLYISWDLVPGMEGIEERTLTKEYSGDGYKNERILTNVQIPSRASYKQNWLLSHQFSKDGKYLLVEDYKFPQGEKPIYDLIVYDVPGDKVISKFNLDSLTTNRRYYEWYYTPDIANDLLLYSFNRSEAGPILTELAIYDYKNIILKRKINVPLKGIGLFSSTGSRIIFSTFPDTQTWKKDVIVFDTNTGTQIGKASLDEMDKIDDISFDDKQIIYKRNGVEMRIDLVK